MDNISWETVVTTLILGGLISLIIYWYKNRDDKIQDRLSDVEDQVSNSITDTIDIGDELEGIKVKLENIENNLSIKRRIKRKVKAAT